MFSLKEGIMTMTLNQMFRNLKLKNYQSCLTINFAPSCLTCVNHDLPITGNLYEIISSPPVLRYYSPTSQYHYHRTSSMQVRSSKAHGKAWRLSTCFSFTVFGTTKGSNAFFRGACSVAMLNVNQLIPLFHPQLNS